MHTKGKWTTRELEENFIDIIVDDNSGRLIGQICKVHDNAESNAKHIVQMHNSFDGLLEACKILYEAVANSEHQLSSRGNGAICKIARQAIAQAEKPE